MDARILRELELDGVARLYGPLPEVSSSAPFAVAPPAPRPAAPPVPVRAVRVEGLDWLVVAGGEGEGPFAAAEGRLLDAMLASVGGRRSPGDPASVAEGFAQRPALVLALGLAAARELGVEGPLESLRGTVRRVRDLPVVVTFHPAELLEAGSKKACAWQDLLFARRSTQTP